ncbi:uncharacterized protein BO80DRAFT_441894 [Aspergillus ibericus CBS 121593]|uniref:Uncharacterized protein n=1 Tax=Aspergillus ibericus CBS 121593 TaxID=1448316 RepID=A0A395H9S8_9EURO|nr:hypothetical protein BO80DRAFT_441894 [Aspergillus ibericus CBS 121593]RAL04430.1 hypothetical protein BO80DRAFT_441894 [Aspergillus ibericus CBS 121593]
MDRNTSTRNTSTNSHGTNNSSAALPDLATYQAQWAKIHDDTVRQINEAREQERRRTATRSQQSPSS